MPIDVYEQAEMFLGLPELAQRLGVEKMAEGEFASVSMRMKNGDQYDLFKLVNAFLDRVDAATRS